MARTSTSLRKSSPYAWKSKSKHPRSYPKYERRSSLHLYSGAPRRTACASHPPPSNGRFFHTPGHLDSIREGSTSTNRRRSSNSHTFRDYRDSDVGGMTNSCEEDVAEEHEGESVSEEEDSFFHWEEESTLFSDLMDDNPYESDDGKLSALVDSLQTPFDEQGVQLKKEIAEAFVPTVNHVKARYEELHEQVDVPFGKGLFLFNKACKDMELAALKEQDELKSAHIASQKRIDELFKQLKEEYARRDQLWIDFEQELNELVEPVLETIQETPAKIERTIASFEKQSKALEEEAKPALDEKKLKELLKKLG